MYVLIIPIYSCPRALSDVSQGTSAQPAIWTVIETSMGIVCSCLPVISGLFTKTLLKDIVHNFGKGGLGKLVRSQRLYFSRSSKQSSQYAESPVVVELDSFACGQLSSMKGGSMSTTMSGRNIDLDVEIPGHKLDLDVRVLGQHFTTETGIA